MGLMGKLKKKKKDKNKDSDDPNQAASDIASGEDDSDELGLDLSGVADDDSDDDDSDELNLDLSGLSPEEGGGDGEGEEEKKEDDDDPLGGGLMDIFAEEAESSGEMDALTDYLEDIDMESLLLQANDIVDRFRSLRQGAPQ